MEIELPGEVVGSRDAQLASAGGGHVEAVLVRAGEQVRQGQALARVNAALFSAQRDQARAQREQAGAELERVKAMGDLASRQQLLAAETQGQLSAAALRMAEIQLARSVISAPFSGKVGTVDLEVGEVLAPGMPVIRLFQLDPVHVEISVGERDVLALRPGMKAAVRTDTGGRVWPAEVHSVDPAADLSSRSFLIKLSVPNPESALLPGMITSVQVETSLAEGALVIPQDWLVSRDDALGVYAVEQDRAAWRPVQVGAVVHDQVVVQSGLQVGDRVVAVGHRALADGDPLMVVREGVCCTRGRPTW
jgi:membrane fusion protein (multidrug efflux system)